MSKKQNKCIKCGKPTINDYNYCGNCYYEEQIKNYKYENCYFTELPIYNYTKCLICGEETNGYAFCYECYKSITNDELLKIYNNKICQEMNKLPNIYNECIDCHKKTNGKPLCKDCYEISIKTEGLEETIKNIKNHTKNNTKKINKENIKWTSEKYTKCLNCGKETNGYAFCIECDTNLKYEKQKELIENFIKEKNNETITEKEDIRKKWKAEYKTTHGEYVRSRAEVIIANILHNKKVQYEYEKQIIFINKTKALCDFYLPEYKTYIEFWGSDEEYYIKRKKEKIVNYGTLKNYKLLQIGDEELKHIDDFIDEIIDTN